MFEAEDEKSCKAPRIYNPVCAYNGREYRSFTNEAYFNCAKEEDPGKEIQKSGTRD